MSSHLFPVEASHLLFFARAIGDPAADDTDYRRALAPPTFGVSHVQFEPGFRLRPAPGRPWMGSGRNDSGAVSTGFGSGLHAEQEFEYFRPLRAGMVLRVEAVRGTDWTKARRGGGSLAFSELLVRFHDDTDDSLVQQMRMVAVEILPEATPPAPTAPAPVPTAQPAVSAAAPGSLDPDLASRLPELNARRQTVVLDEVTRSALVMYAGASGDYNPLHTDEVFATRVAGYPSVFAHGMLTMGASGRAVTDWVGVDLLRSYRAQFRGQVWPGDVLTVSAVVEARERFSATIGLTTTTQDDRVVMTGRAVLGGTPPPAA